ncbi:MAG: hypothetical protein Q8L37_02425 [Candidatus Gottesmanbacteria bacterium]|nr:hypothetical protein [Candidatus Gottesmanbacteria bacterium]
MNNKLVVGLLVLLVGVGAGWYFLKGNSTYPDMTKKDTSVVTKETPAVEPTVSLGSDDSATGASGGAMEKGGATKASATVTYDAQGFTPKSVTVKVGSTVRWANKGTQGMWVASAMHPTHQLLPGFDQLKSVTNGGTYEYTFVKVGTWKYHNHVLASDFGTVVVTE